MPKNIPGIVRRNRRRPVEKVRILVQPNPYPLEQPGMQPNVSNPMNAPMSPDYANPAPQQMQQGAPGPMLQQMQQQGSPAPVPAPPPVSGPIVPMQSNGQWHGDPNGQAAAPFSQGGNQPWQGPAGPGQMSPGQAGPGASPNGMPQQQGAYNNQQWSPNSAQQTMTPPQMQHSSTPLPYNNNMPPQQVRHTPPPANNISSQPGLTPAPQYASAPPQYNPSQPHSQSGLTPLQQQSQTPVMATPAPAAPRTPSNSGLLGRSGPASLSGVAGTTPSSTPTAHTFVEIDGKITQEVRLDRPVLTVGRQDGRDVQIKHQSVSRTHARIVAENGAWFVEDAGSVNGIVFNGQRVQRTVVHNGDRVFVAPNISLLFKIA